MKKISLSLAALLLVLFSHLTQAALPPAVNNQTVPSLAPILQKMMPAIVNIKVQGTTDANGGGFNDEAAENGEQIGNHPASALQYIPALLGGTAPWGALVPLAIVEASLRGRRDPTRADSKSGTPPFSPPKHEGPMGRCCGVLPTGASNVQTSVVCSDRATAKFTG